VEQLLAWIYPNRVLVGVATLVAMTFIALIAWRRGWHRVAARHRMLTAIAVVVALAVAVPTTWYLASPLIIRTELVETPPPIAAAPSTTPSGSVATSASAASTSSPAPAPTPLVLQGTFVGADDFHFAKGSARVVETAPGRFVLRLEKFSVRNGPDLYVYLSPDAKGYAKGSVELGRLKATDGSFNYQVPLGTPTAKLRSVVIWCKAFSVQFGHAELS
jgi:hypothetical protein